MQTVAAMIGASSLLNHMKNRNVAIRAGAGEAYESKDGCKNRIASIKENAPKAEIVDTAQ